MMKQGISTHVFLPQRLTPSLLDALLAAGPGVIEVFAARHHFDYTDRGAVRELAGWFRSNDVAAAMHMPIFAPPEDGSEVYWTRHTAATLNLLDAHKASRIAAMDEVKRALEAAEQVPFKSCVLHLGQKEDRWDSRALDDALTAIEHLKAFASPLGVTLLLENLNNEVARPAHLVEIVRVGHFDNVGFCLDLGHAHLEEASPETADGAESSGVAQAFGVFGERLAELHVHDNHGLLHGLGKDEHLWPGDGTIDWAEVARLTAKLKQVPASVLEIAYDTGASEAQIATKAQAAWETLAGE